jgi:lipopolysaccharide/colanic/teichoic acid biosynthesis glycosyltransferase
MHDGPAGTGIAAKDDHRLTWLGRLLRLSSLDELPQIFNVLKGEMSLVGPRPQIVSFGKYYSPFQSRRHEVKPGITGWAQINGRNSISWDRKFELDVWYVDNWSMLLDLKILALTPWRLLFFKEVVGPYRCSEFSFGSQHDSEAQDGSDAESLIGQKRSAKR